LEVMVRSPDMQVDCGGKNVYWSMKEFWRKTNWNYSKLSIALKIILQMKNISCLLLVFFLIVSCKPSKTEYKIGVMDFIVGSWGNNADTANMFYESWQKTNDSTFTGTAYTLGGAGDTLFSESVSLTERNGIISYNPSVKDQNEDKAVPFVFSKQEGDSIYWFTNPKHDFPKAIVYKKISADSILVWIEGVVFEEFRKELFPMNKLK
jgi:Domain of unknown function (DUF6265)